MTIQYEKSENLPEQAMTPQQTIWTDIFNLLNEGIAMEPMRQLTDKKPADMSQADYYAALGANAELMRKLQAKAKELDEMASELGHVVLTAAAREVQMVCSLSQKAHDMHRESVYKLLTTCAQDVWHVSD